MFWKRFDKKKPKENGWYQCTVDMDGLRFVTDLYWKDGRFRDNDRQDVFDTYDVYEYNYSTHEYDRSISTDQYCDLTKFVIAWKKLPKPYRRDLKERSNER